jgi:hypothetical protein
MAWVHKDITYCNDYSCPLVSCIRNPKHLTEFADGIYSFAALRGTDECPIYQMERNAETERDDCE